LVLKRGLLYSIMTLALLTPVILFATLHAYQLSEESAFLVSSVVGRELSNYAESISVDFPRALKASSHSAVIGAINHVIGSGAPLDNARATISELAVNGTFQGVPSSIMGGSESNNTLLSWVERIEEKGQAYGFEVEAELVYYNVTQLNHRELLFEGNISVFTRADSFHANFSRVYSASVTVDLNGMEDPLLPLNTYGVAQRTLEFNSSNVCGLSAFDSAISQGIYWPSPDGASFLDRLEGRDYTSEYYAAQGDEVVGMQSVVDLDYLIAQELPVELNKSMVDNHYFNATAPEAWAVNGSAHWWAYLSNEAAAYLGVTLDN